MSYRLYVHEGSDEMQILDLARIEGWEYLYSPRNFVNDNEYETEADAESGILTFKMRHNRPLTLRDCVFKDRFETAQLAKEREWVKEQIDQYIADIKKAKKMVRDALKDMPTVMPPYTTTRYLLFHEMFDYARERVINECEKDVIG